MIGCLLSRDVVDISVSADKAVTACDVGPVVVGSNVVVGMVVVVVVVVVVVDGGGVVGVPGVHAGSRQIYNGQTEMFPIKRHRFYQRKKNIILQH